MLNAAAEAHGKTAGQIALKYLLQNGVIVIPKTSRRERMEENIGLFDFTLDEEEMKQISALNENRSLFGWYD